MSAAVAPRPRQLVRAQPAATADELRARPRRSASLADDARARQQQVEQRRPRRARRSDAGRGSAAQCIARHIAPRSGSTPNHRSNASAPCSTSIPSPSAARWPALARRAHPRRLVRAGTRGRPRAASAGSSVDGAREARRRAGRRASRSRRASAPSSAVVRVDDTARDGAEARGELLGACPCCDCRRATRAPPPSFRRGTAPPPRCRRRRAAPPRAVARASPSSARAIASTPPTSVLSPTQRAVLVPERVHRAARARPAASARRSARRTASLCGIVTLPAASLGARASRASSSKRVGRDVERLVRERNARGARARRSGSAARANARPDARAGRAGRAARRSRCVRAALRGEAVEHAPDLALELVGRRAIDLELAADRIADRRDPPRRASGIRR